MKRSISVIMILAEKEIRDGLRNRWVASTIVLLGALALMLSYLGSVPSGEIKVGALEVSVVSLTSLSMYLLPLIALMLSFDALVGEFEHGTMLLLLTYPVQRWQIIAGKFLGHLLILLLAILIGYGGTMGLMIYQADGDMTGWQVYLAMMASSLLLGSAFLAIGYLVSLLSRERAIAIGAAFSVWLLVVVLYDLGLLSALLVEEGKYISERALSVLLLANPADAYRLFNFAGFEEVGRLVGVNDIPAGFESGLIVPLISLLSWIIGPFFLTTVLFQRREL